MTYGEFLGIAKSEEWTNLIKLLKQTFKSTLLAIDRHSKHSRIAWDNYKGRVKLQRLEEEHSDKKRRLQERLKVKAEKRRRRERGEVVSSSDESLESDGS